jgi:hypothetical protein
MPCNLVLAAIQCSRAAYFDCGLSIAVAGADVVGGAPLVRGAGEELGAARIGARAAEGGGEAATALTQWEPDFAAKQLLGGNNVTAGSRTITYHAADRIVNSGRGIGLSDIDSILDNGVRLRYNPLAPGGPTIRVLTPSGGLWWLMRRRVVAWSR